MERDRTRSKVGAAVRRLFQQYHDALAVQKAKQEALQTAAQRATELRLKIEEKIQASGLSIYRAVFFTAAGQMRPKIRRIAAGRNLNAFAILEAAGIGGTGGGPSPCEPDCPACQHAMEQMADDPNWLEGACICTCCNGQGGVYTVVECPPPPTEPE
jgi:hypothetical protein